MTSWTNLVERKAGIIYAQLAKAQELARANSASEAEVAEPYLQLLAALYSEEYTLAQLSDSSDLIARFTGPAVDSKSPSFSLVLYVLNEIRKQIRGIARSIAGLADSSETLRWPSHLDPHVSGLTHGSLVVGVRVPNTDDISQLKQHEFPGISDEILQVVRAAVKSIANVPRFVSESDVLDEIRQAFPDPAIRDAVLVAAGRLSPTGRRGIESATFLSSEDEFGPAMRLTPKSRRVINKSLHSPVKIAKSGTFEGVVREIDLDAQRVEIRSVHGVGGLRCAYAARSEETIRGTLDARVRVSGDYEALTTGRPRLLAIQTIEILEFPPRQLHLRTETSQETSP
jgi:hypothetical protein